MTTIDLRNLKYFTFSVICWKSLTKKNGQKDFMGLPGKLHPGGLNLS